MIVYTDSLDGIVADHLRGGFLAGWRNPLTPDQHLAVLTGSDHVVLARDDTTGAVVGFVTAITDGVLSAYIPLLEVLPGYQGRGIGTEITERMLAKLENFRMVDLLCDLELQPFYRRLGVLPATGMMARRYHLL